MEKNLVGRQKHDSYGSRIEIENTNCNNKNKEVGNFPDGLKGNSAPRKDIPDFLRKNNKIIITKKRKNAFPKSIPSLTFCKKH